MTHVTAHTWSLDNSCPFYLKNSTSQLCISAANTPREHCLLSWLQFEKGDNPTPCPALPSTHMRSSKGSCRFENACRKVLGGRVGHRVTCLYAGQERCSLAASFVGPKGPTSERPRAGGPVPLATQHAEHTRPSCRRWSACAVTNPCPVRVPVSGVSA